MTLRSARLCLAAGMVVFAAGRLPAQPPRPIPPANRSNDNFLIDYNIQGADVDAVLQNLEDFTGRTVIRPQALTPFTYTLKMRATKSDLIIALESLLEANGVAVIPLGDKYLKVVPLQLARTEAPELIEGSTLDLPPSDRVVTKLFQFQFLRVEEFFTPQLIQGMFSPNIAGNVVTVPKANAAFVTDTLANVQRTERLVEKLDQPLMAGLKPKFYTLQNGAKASDVVNKLKTILSGPLQNQIGTATTYSADDRTNQIILLADPHQEKLFDELIEKLDVTSTPNTRNEVIYLKHADAQTVAPILQQLVQGQVAAAQKATTAQSLRPGEASSGPNQGQNGAPAVPGGIAGLPGGGTLAPSPAAQAVASAAASNPNNEFSTLAVIQADERSNSIIISGTVDDIRLIKELIAKIDIVLAQVRIEVIVAEVTLTDTDQSGITALGLTVGTDNVRGTHITNFTGSVPGWDVTSGVVNPLAFQAALNSTTTGSRNLVKILQTPVITTTHAKQGEVNVGEKDPLITSTQSTPVSGGTTSSSGFATNSTVSYTDISVDLKVTPLIGDDGNIAMTIDQVVDDIIGNVTINGNTQPIIGHRETTSFINCKDGQMVVLGGLQRTVKSTTQTKLGLLFEIPILSQLLGGHTDELDRTELLIFVRPHVIPPDEATADTKEEVKVMSNKKDINAFLQDPSKQPDRNDKKQNLLDRF
jgi:general secretion pathway protein D